MCNAQSGFYVPNTTYVFRTLSQDTTNSGYQIYYTYDESGNALVAKEKTRRLSTDIGGFYAFGEGLNATTDNSNDTCNITFNSSNWQYYYISTANDHNISPIGAPMIQVYCSCQDYIANQRGTCNIGVDHTPGTNYICVNCSGCNWCAVSIGNPNKTAQAFNGGHPIVNGLALSAASVQMAPAFYVPNSYYTFTGVDPNNNGIEVNILYDGLGNAYVSKKQVNLSSYPSTEVYFIDDVADISNNNGQITYNSPDAGWNYYLVPSDNSTNCPAVPILTINCNCNNDVNSDANAGGCDVMHIGGGCFQCNNVGCQQSCNMAYSIGTAYHQNGISGIMIKARSIQSNTK